MLNVYGVYMGLSYLYKECRTKYIALFYAVLQQQYKDNECVMYFNRRYWFLGFQGRTYGGWLSTVI